MGVHGLWKLLEPAGKPVPLETLENKVLAVDVSIWLYQLTKGLQTTGGGAVPNAHILGLFNRICKLLYYRIKPVFVFDGSVPLLKKETIETRRLQKLKAKDNSEQLREKLLNNLLKQKAVNQLLGNEDIPGTSQEGDSDLFALPPLPEEETNTKNDTDGESDTDMGTAKIESFCDFQLGKDVHSIDITSQQFKSLPPEIRHEILSELQETRKQSSWGRIHEMPEESTDFSKYQMSRLMKRRNVQRSLDEAAKEIGGRPMTLGELEEMFIEEGIVTDSLRGKRIAGDDVTRYIYIKGKKLEEKTPEKNLVLSENIGNSTNSSIPPEKACENGESEFRNSFYEIDQCIFMKDSSSDDDNDDDVNPENDRCDYANQLSLDEQVSQKEILRLIIEQNVKKTASPQPSDLSGTPLSCQTQSNDSLPSSSGITKEKSVSNLSVEDVPMIVERSEHDISYADSDTAKDHQETQTTSKIPQTAECNVDNKVLVTLQSSNISNSDIKSLTTLTPLSANLSSPYQQNGSSKSVTTRQFEKTFTENETSTYAKSMLKLDEMINSVTGVGSSMGQLNPSKIVNAPDETESLELLSSSDSDDDMVEVTGSANVESPYFGETKTQMEIVIDPSQIGKDDIFFDVFSTMNQKVVEDEEDDKVVVESQKNKLPEEEEMKKSTIVQKDDGRYKKLAEIFQKVKKVTNENKAVPKETDCEFPSEIQNEELLSVQRELHIEEMELQNERGRQERLGSTISQQMIIEAQELLQLFGLPYIIAPMEAEAQCAFLDQAQLTDGTITDDSDIWLFGGQKVYKNFFDNRKYVLQFRNVDIEHFFKLTREQLIQMAMLVGSDYTVGIEGIGPVTAIEILAYFSDKSNKPETEADIAETLRKFKQWIDTNRGGASALSRKVKNVTVSEGFPSMAVIEAYMFPTVDESREGFTWATPDLDHIRQFMKSKFGWKMKRIDEILLPVIKRLNNHTKQTTLDAFFNVKPHMSIDSGNISKRVIQAISIMKNKVDVNVMQLPTKSPRKSRTKTNKSSSTKSSANSSLKKKQTTEASMALLKSFSPLKSGSSSQEVIPQREKDRLEAAKRKLDAVKILQKNRRGKGTMKKRKTPKPRKDSSYLSESSSNED